MLEREGLFHPMFRIQFPKYTEKIRTVQNGYEILGALEEGELWDGETKEAFGGFYFKKKVLEDFYREGLLWNVSSRPFEPWKTFHNERGDKIIESYYSPFQIYLLWNIWETTTFSISLISLAALDEGAVHSNASKDRIYGKKLLKLWAEGESRFSEAADISIAIANRYFPQTQTDRRTMTLSTPVQYHDWSWYEYRRRWVATAELAKLGIAAEKLRDLQRNLAAEARHIDPISDWYSLVQFIAPEHKRRLKGKALLAHWLYAMEMMIRLFYEDVTGHRLPAPDDNYQKWKDGFYGQGVPDRELEFLEYLTNQFHINPRPKLILVVEGEGEAEQIPRIAGAIGYSFEQVGIRLEMLGGIGEFTGRKREPQWGGRLARFIDYHHNLQTLVVLILDNENGSGKVRDSLLKTRSKYQAGRHYVTKREYVFLWNRNFEFDNFTDAEIADRLSTVAEKPRLFSKEEVQRCRRDFGKPGKGLENLFDSKVKRRLNKRELMKLLVDGLLEKASSLDESDLPPIVKKVEEIIHLAARNYPPISRDSWSRNQTSDFLASIP